MPRCALEHLGQAAHHRQWPRRGRRWSASSSTSAWASGSRVAGGSRRRWRRPRRPAARPPPAAPATRGRSGRRCRSSASSARGRLPQAGEDLVHRSRRPSQTPGQLGRLDHAPEQPVGRRASRRPASSAAVSMVVWRPILVPATLRLRPAARSGRCRSLPAAGCHRPGRPAAFLSRSRCGGSCSNPRRRRLLRLASFAPLLRRRGGGGARPRRPAGPALA